MGVDICGLAPTKKIGEYFHEVGRSNFREFWDLLEKSTNLNTEEMWEPNTEIGTLIISVENAILIADRIAEFLFSQPEVPDWDSERRSKHGSLERFMIFCRHCGGFKITF